MTAYFIATNKRRNSMHVPPTTGALTADINLKAQTDIVRPIFEVQAVSTPRAYNYIDVPTLSRSYFVDRWEYDRTVWYAHCTEDVLASYSAGIRAATKYVLRSTSNPSVGVTDTFYPLTDVITHEVTGTSLGWAQDFSTGWYVVGLIGHGSASSISAGSVTYYVMSSAQLSTLVQYMLSGVTSTDWSDMASLRNDVVKTLSDPLQYIVSCLYFPFQPPLGATTTVTFGFWDVPGLQANLLGAATDTVKSALDIHQISGWDRRNNPYFWGWLDPISTYVLQFNPFGTVTLPAALIAGHYYLGFEMKTDFVSGAGICSLYAHDDSLPGSFGRIDQLVICLNAQVGVQVQLTQNTSSLVTAVGKTAIGFVGGIAGGAVLAGAVGGVVGGLLGGAKSALDSMKDSFVSTGAAGGIVGDEGYVFLHAYRKNTAASSAARAEFGDTCYQSLQLGNLSGYVLCADGELQLYALGDERQMIADYLTSGIYMEA